MLDLTTTDPLWYSQYGRIGHQETQVSDCITVGVIWSWPPISIHLHLCGGGCGGFFFGINWVSTTIGVIGL